jgi:Cu(I)/Ag(I) efflux system membrane fusion protein
MNRSKLMPNTRASRLALLGIVASGAIGFGVARLTEHPGSQALPASSTAKPVLYWYDPMTPSQHFDKPGKSPFMEMELLPKYADQAGPAATPGVTIDPAQLQRLGARIVAVERGSLSSGTTATGSIDFNQRDVAIVQARSGGFVQRVYARAPGDIIKSGAPIADLLVPEWGGAQTEYLAVRRVGDPALTRAARERLTLLGMSPGQIAAIDRDGRTHNVTTISSPIGGVIKALGVRGGMTLSQGMTLAEVDGLGTVWLNAAVPEAIAGRLRVGATTTATLAALPGETVRGRITAILPEADATSRTLTVRIELPNKGGRLRPGMFATVALADGARPALLVPSEAVIRTGTRTLVMLAGDGGRFRPAEVQTGVENGGKTEILAGLHEGEKIVASGQFLIDSEASLSGVAARPIGGDAQPAGRAAPKPAVKQATSAAQTFETTGVIEAIDAGSVTFSHQPVPALGWPAMTMAFHVADPALIRGYKRGDTVRFVFDQPNDNPTLRRLSHEAGK